MNSNRPTWEDSGGGMMEEISTTNFNGVTGTFTFTVARNELHFFEFFGCENTNSYNTHMYVDLSADGGSSYYGSTNVYSYQTTQTHAYGSNHSRYDYNGGIIKITYQPINPTVAANGSYENQHLRMWYMQRTDEHPHIWWQIGAYDYQRPYHTLGGGVWYNSSGYNMNKLRISNFNSNATMRGTIRHFRQQMS